jgi:hypothetical protein
MVSLDANCNQLVLGLTLLMAARFDPVNKQEGVYLIERQRRSLTGSQSNAIRLLT